MRREQLTRVRRSIRAARMLAGGFIVLGVGLCSVVSCSTQGTPGGTEETGQKEPQETETSMGGVPYMPHRMIQAPEKPPGLFVEGGANTELPRVAVDWSVLGGPSEEPGGEVDWSTSTRRTASSDLTLEFDTEQIPTRVVVYSYTEVGEDGIPDEGSGTETLCSFREDGVDGCHYHGDGSGNAQVMIDSPRPEGHLVVHAAWPTETKGGAMDVASASWLLRPDV